MTKSESLGNFVAFMDSIDIGRLFVPGSKREMSALVPDYSQDEDGVDSVKVLMATPNLIMFEAFRPAGKIDRMHMHKDCLLYTSPSPRDATLSRMPSCA